MALSPADRARLAAMLLGQQGEGKAGENAPLSPQRINKIGPNKCDAETVLHRAKREALDTIDGEAKGGASRIESSAERARVLQASHYFLHCPWMYGGEKGKPEKPTCLSGGVLFRAPVSWTN